MEQTAVEWLVEKMLTVDWYTYKAAEFIEQAKEMEKEQIIDAYEDGTYHNTFGNENYESSEEYYNSTFKSE